MESSPSPPDPTPRPGSAPSSTNEKERSWAMLCHLSALAGLLLPPVGHVLGPLMVWLWKRHDYPMVDRQGRESLNFQISMSLYWLIASLLTALFIGFVLLFILTIMDLGLVIWAAIRVNRGIDYRYPFTLRLL